jgi:hypothetical protein
MRISVCSNNKEIRIPVFCSIILCFTLNVKSGTPGISLKGERWTIEQASDWYKDVGTIKGFNYLPRTAGNSTEMWQESSYRPDIIEQELSWAESAGYNSIRAFMQYLVWQDDPEGTKLRMDEFMKIASGFGMSVTWVLFDDCAFGYPASTDPYLGKQGEPLPGEFMPYWTPSPGHSLVIDESQWKSLEKYVKDILKTFAEDKRVLMWDIYNEPGMSGMGSRSMPLLEEAFKWARNIAPNQPVTTGVYQSRFTDRIPLRIMELSDIITFHSYDHVSNLSRKIRICKSEGRPAICTEFMIRRNGNDLFTCLPAFAENQTGWYNWGLVAGKMQSWLHWGSQPGSSTPKKWQHDLFYSSGMPYDPEEVELIREFKFYEKYKETLPTSEDSVRTWHYITDPPDYGWHIDGEYDYNTPFQGSVWKEGEAPFGNESKGVNTVWDNNNIWIRSGFNLEYKPLNPHIKILHDDEVEVYINGELAYKSRKGNTYYELVPFSWRGRAAIKAGENVISVHCHKATGESGGQLIDVGIVDLLREGEEPPEILAPGNLKVSTDIDVGDVWSAERAWEWYKKVPPIKGSNFLPSTAANSVEMWVAETFDPETIDRELEWAHNFGFNSIRVYLNYAAWEADPAGFKGRLDQFLEIADRNKISTMLVFFDDCCFAMKLEPLLGRQDDPVPGVTNSAWVPSPGYSMVADTSTHSLLETYVKDIVGRFKNDPRILVWDIYNEPGPFFDRTSSFALAKLGMRWTRELEPIQPVTVAVWGNRRSSDFVELSDVVSLHSYSGYEAMEDFFRETYEKTGKPVIVTECMIRNSRASFAAILPAFSKYNMGWYNWGFVGGRIQTYNYYGQVRCSIIRDIPMCDVVWPDGKPFYQEEIDLIQDFRFEPLPENIQELFPME